MSASDAEARREAQGKRTKAALMKKPCPVCKVARLWRGPILGARGKVRCLECGAKFKLNLA